MLKYLTLLFLCPAVFGAMDTVTIKHRYYSTTFDRTLKYPVLVHWWVTKRMLSCQNRIDRDERFRPDPLLNGTDLENSYKGSGYDRGHNMPAYDNGCDSVGMSECFYFSNMAPQTPRVNRGDWKELEKYTRDTCLKYDSIKVWCGSVGSVKKIGSVTVPKYCWKVLYIKKLRTYQAYLFANDTSASTTVQAHRTTTGALYKLTKIRVKK